MIAPTVNRVTTVRIAEHDPDLFDEASDPAAAAAASLAETEWLETGYWEPPEYDTRGHYGLLILDGVLIRHVLLGVRDGLELLGPGDLIRPWVGFGGGSSIEVTTRWAVHERARLAHLDRRFAVRMAPWPEVAGCVMDREMRRQRFLAMHLAISQMPRLESRLRVLFWYLADRWGRVTSDGVVLDLPLTHELVAGLVGARRPGVTSALGVLQRSGEFGRRSDGRWTLHGEPPEELRAASFENEGAAR